MTSSPIDLPPNTHLLGPCDLAKHPTAEDILEGDEFDMAWHLAAVPLADLAKYDGYLDNAKRDDLLKVADHVEMAALLLNNPPLFFRIPGRGWYLLDGQHRLTRARALGLDTVTIAFAYSLTTD